MSKLEHSIKTVEPQRGGEAPVVLIVDDEPSICWAFERMLTEQGHQVVTASSAEQGLEIADQQPIKLVLLDVRLPKEDGISALPKFIAATSGSPVIVMTAFGDLETAVAAVERGASDYLIKPFRLDEARRVCNVALSASRPVGTAMPLTAKSERIARLVGSSAAMQQAFRQIALVAGSDLSVLVTGETGTGKELVGAAIHRHSLRSSGPYLAIAPVALNEDLIESELFGHVKGAFTGAENDRPGLFERAEGGTVLLDEIGDLPISVQVKLLRVLEQGEYFRVGDVKPRRCNVRILAATHRDLHEAMRVGQFREDLYYRLAGLHIHLPALRDRREDIGPLCRHFLNLFGHAASAESLSSDLIQQLAERPWHGNVRELANAIERAAVLARGRSLTIDDFPVLQPGLDSTAQVQHVSQLEQAVALWCRIKLAEMDSTSITSSALHAELNSVTEPILVQAALRHVNGNRAAAAEILGIHRGTLREKLRQYQID